MIAINNTLSERIFEQLKDNILTGVYQPGNRMLYKQLAADFKVSMTPVREALLKLEQEGIVKTIPRKGVYIIKLTDQDVIEYTKIRFSMEALAIDSICENRSPPEEIRRLEHINRELEDAIKNREPVPCMTRDMEFHQTIVEICGNKRLFELIKQLPLTNFFANRGNQNRMIEIGANIIKQHSGIVNNLYEYNPEAAKLCLKENILFPQYSIVTDPQSSEG
ncbi:GntR family transcriptional regulator [Spirochaetia bacterium]|nr:GntR family transcriptional regulator [Spirochaetia bacterium]